ncbi:MAG: CotH kinase family protein [Ruminiclostridium sp.]|nr:CotH kinase family protein [Ruminiclostridium sp.]
MTTSAVSENVSSSSVAESATDIETTSSASDTEETTTTPAETTADTEKSETTTETTVVSDGDSITVTEIPETEVTEEVSSAETAEAVETEEITSESTVTEAVSSELVMPEAEIDTTNEDGKKMYQQYMDQKEKYIKRYEKLCTEMTLPIVSIITLDNKEILSKEEYVTSVVDVFNCEEEYSFSASGGVKVRGNSTADGDEKPYRIKFDSKQNMLGLHNGAEYKSWVLLRSQWNLAMDYTGFNLAKAIFQGEYYSSDCKYVDVYVNGRFKGIYLLCEQNQAADGRVDIYEPDATEKYTDIGYLVEIDNYANEWEDPFFTVDYLGAEITDISGRTEAFVPADYSIKSDINGKPQAQFIEKYIKGVFEILYEGAEKNNPMMFDSDYNVVSAKGTYNTAREAVEAVIDLESLANVLILDELVHDYDVGEGSFYMTVDFSSGSKYKKLTFLAPWDFNWAYDGTPNRRYFACTFQPLAGDIDRSNPWYITAMKAEWFMDVVKEKWAYLYENNVITDVTKQIRKDVELLRNDLGDENWKVDNSKYIMDFVDGRVKWLTKQWLEGTE